MWSLSITEPSYERGIAVMHLEYLKRWFFFFFIYWLLWVFVASWAFSLVAASGRLLSSCGK